MKVEKFESVVINVKNLDESINLFSEILGIEFANLGELEIDITTTEPKGRALQETKMKVAIGRGQGGFIELLEASPPVEKEGLRRVFLKVPNLERAKAEMKQKGIRLIANAKVGVLKEAVYSPDDLHGIPLGLMEYEAPTALDAILQQK